MRHLFKIVILAFILHLTPSTLHSTPSTLHPTPSILNSQFSILNSQFSTQVRLGLQTSAGYGTFIEGGAGPMLFHGLEMASQLSLQVEYPEWLWSVDLMIPTGAYAYRVELTTPCAYGLMPQLQLKALKRVKESNNWEFHAGAGVNELFDLRYITPLGNSGVGTSNFISLILLAKETFTTGRWSFHAELGFVPLSIATRPGFSYMANYDRSLSEYVSTHFSGHQWYVTWANALHTETGATLLLHNGNRIGLTYRWNYLTSKISDNAPHRFDHASHLLQLSFLFAL